MTTTIPPRSDHSVAPASYAQELLWHLDRAAAGLTAYNVPRMIRIRGRLDADALRAALDAVIERHEVLRTTYSASESGVHQHVQPHAPLTLEIVDLRGRADAGAASAQLALDAARTPFDLTRDRLLRAQLLRLDDAEHVLVLVSHHIASDGWSRDVLFRELSHAYTRITAGGAPELEPLPIQYADFAEWQRARGESDALAAQLAYWVDRLADAPVLQLPTTFARPSVTGFEGSRVVATLPPSLVGDLRRFATERGATLYMVLLAAYQCLLHRYTEQSDIVVGSPIAARDLPETEPLIGYFANTLALRTSFAGAPSFADVLDRVVDGVVDAFDHAEVPFERVQLHLRERGGMSGDASLVRAVLTMEDTLPASLSLGDAEVTLESLDYGQAKFDLTLLVAEDAGALRLSLWFRTDLFDEAFARAALTHLQTLIESALATPDLPVHRLPMLSATERDAVLALGIGPTGATAQRRLDACVAEHARRTPERIAARSGATALTYRELDARAERLARRLRRSGATGCVGLFEDRSLEAIAGILGILKADCAYVPLVPEVPVARLRQQVTEAGVRVVVCTRANADRAAAMAHTVITLDDVAEGADDADAAESTASRPLADASLAYVLFTSGSTGTPKGVAVTHANVAAYASAMLTRLGAPEATPWTYGLVTTLGADLGGTALFPALVSGGTVDVIPQDTSRGPLRFAEYLAAHPIDVLKITPGHMHALRAGATGDAAMPREWLVVGGEPLPVTLARELLAASPRVRLLNHYGPTEATVGCCTYEVVRDAVPSTASGTVPIGRPLRGVRAYVVDAAGAPVPIGIPGELWIAGDGVAAGYVGHPDWTAERFVGEPGATAGARAYRTGDRVRWLASGDVEFLGRLDHQLKIRGYRVELGEVEATVARQPDVARAVVVARGEAGARELVAFVETARAPAELRQALATELPDYMVPADVVAVTEWPLTRNGKIDRDALLAMTRVHEVPVVAPRTETERRLATIWCAVLKRDSVGVSESFFDMGGHSLLAIRVLGRISREFGVRLPLRALFDAATIEALAVVIDAAARPVSEEDALRAALASVAQLSEAEVTGLIGNPANPGRR